MLEAAANWKSADVGRITISARTTAGSVQPVTASDQIPASAHWFSIGFPTTTATALNAANVGVISSPKLPSAVLPWPRFGP